MEIVRVSHFPSTLNINFCFPQQCSFSANDCIKIRFHSLVPHDYHTHFFEAAAPSSTSRSSSSETTSSSPSSALLAAAALAIPSVLSGVVTTCFALPLFRGEACFLLPVLTAVASSSDSSDSIILRLFSFDPEKCHSLLAIFYTQKTTGPDH